jgi:hypothetical protein
MVAMSKRVIECEVEDHGNYGSDGLGNRERSMKSEKQGAQNRKMQNCPGTTYQNEQNETIGDETPEGLVEQENREFQDDGDTELAFSGQSRSKSVGEFDQNDVFSGGGENIQQDFESFPAQTRDSFPE